MFTNRLLNREKINKSYEGLKKNLSSNYFYNTKMCFFSKHILKSHHHEKTYRRIWPAAKHLMIKHNIKEDDLNPAIKVVMKEHILDYIDKIKIGTISSFQKQENSPKQVESMAVTLNKNLFNDSSSTSSDGLINYAEFKLKLPHCYFYNNASIDNLMNYIQEINTTHKKNLKIDDFIAKASAKLISSNLNLRLLFDKSSNSIIRFENNSQNNQKFGVWLKTYSKNKTGFSDEQYVYFNPQKINFSEIHGIKKNLKEFKDEFIPILRIFNYSESNSDVEELIVPPSLLTLSIGGISSKLVSDEINKGKIKVSKSINLALTGVASVHKEEVLVQFLSDLCKIIDQPMTISL